MVKKNLKISVTFEQATVNMLADLAEREHKSISSLVKELTLEALEVREDLYLSEVAEKLDIKDAKQYTHEDAWKIE